MFESAVKWENDCKKEIRQLGLKPTEWEAGANGNIYENIPPYRVIENIITPWKKSVHYKELNINLDIAK
jgi:hypothetical protein